MTNANFSVLDLLDLPLLERELFLRLARNGPADDAALALDISRDIAEVRAALAELERKGRLQIRADGSADTRMGQIASRTTLPAQLWPALLTNGRLYSAQEIVTLRTVVPILQFARAKIGEFVDHGPNHALRVKSYASQLGFILGLSQTEHRLLRAGALFHDVGNIVNRDRHHIISQETVLKLAVDGQLPFSLQEAELVGLLCRWHRREYDSTQIDMLRGEPIRTGGMAAILRVADAMDIDQRRSDYSERTARVLRLFFFDQLPYWASIEEILGVRVRCTPTVHLQVFTAGDIAGNMQVDLLRKDLASTPLEWTIQQIAASDVPIPARKAKAGKPALLVFPFEPHSLVMAAISRAHLTAAGYPVELLCYPDTAGGSAWLWRDALAKFDCNDIAQLVVIGDRPDPEITPDQLATIGRWQSIGASVCLQNRHEANWSRLPKLLAQGAEVILGNDWAYFWGDDVSQAELAWGRIAALCTRDPTQSSVGLTAEEQAVTQGLLCAVYAAASQPANDTAGWARLADPILERIASDDRAWFASQATKFTATYALPTEPGQIEGRVLRFAGAPCHLPQACYWALEAAIEAHGREPERGIHFNVPYAIATWPDDDMVELLAINHWREEEAIPIRLLYPTDLGPQPDGNESALRARLPAAQAKQILEALVEACNQQN
jgi:hypothetical protein